MTTAFISKASLRGTQSFRFCHSVHEILSLAYDLSCIFIQREMPGIKNMHFGAWHLFAVRLRACNGEGRIVFSPKNEQRRLVIAQPLLPNWIRLQIILIIEKQIRLDIGL